MPVDGPAGRLHHVRKVEEHARRTRVAVQDRCQQRTMSAADVNDPPVAGEVVSCCDGGAFVAAVTGHHIVEDLRNCWILGKVVKERFAIDMIKGRPPVRTL